MTEVQRPPTEGWQRDPYGRHEQRFFDGHRWTPYVRDGEQHGIDEPGGPTAEDASRVRSALLDEELLVVERFTDLGRGGWDRSVLRADGTRAGTLRRAASSFERPSLGLRTLVHRDPTKNDVLELVDDTETVALTLIRPLATSKTTVEVRDSEGRDAGRIVPQTLRRNQTTYAFLGPNGRFLGDLQAENGVTWDLRIVDSHGRQVATITRDVTGLDTTRFSRPDDHVVRFSDPVHEPLRTLVLACALSLEVAVRPDARPG